MTQTDKLTEVGKRLKRLLDDNRTELGLTAIYYGDQNLIPKVPALCLEPVQKERELTATQMQSTNTFTIAFMVYHSILGSIQDARLKADEFAETIEAFLHSNKSLDGMLIHSHCTSVESGYAQRGNTIMVTSRLTWQGLSKTQI
jgi:hypothetical protein